MGRVVGKKIREDGQAAVSRQKKLNKSKEGRRLGGSTGGRRRGGRLYKVFRLHGLRE